MLIDENDLGPRHRGVVGRRAASVADYSYSAALKNSDLTWDDSCGRHRLSQGTPLRNKGWSVPAQTYLDNASSYLRHARTRGAEHGECIGVTIASVRC